MTIIKIRTVLIFLLLSILVDVHGQFKKLSGIHDTIDNSIKVKLQKAGYGKVTYYFDDLKKMDGTWELYPSLQISKNFTAVSVSTIPGVESKYTFLLLINPKLNSITDTLGPYYDSAVDAVAAKIVNSKLAGLKVRLINPPEAEEPRYTIIEYAYKSAKLVKTASYDKD
jgi:hypothetical protein